MNRHALSIDLGPLPERPLDPPDPGTADDVYADAEAQIHREAKDLDFWIALFDDAQVDGVDLVRIATALHAAHCRHYDAALDVLLEATISTVAALAKQEAKERLDEMEPDPDRQREEQQDRLEALREDHAEFLEDR